MTTYAKVIEDSISEFGIRLTTVEVELHRFVLAELNTHRVFSRNSASSRAIPVQKQLARVIEDPAYFVTWPCEQPGMSGGNELVGDAAEDAFDLYENIRINTAHQIDKYLRKHPEPSERLHKSLLNRFLEPFMWHRVIISSTDWHNFFEQRCHPAAQPEFRIAAEMIQDAIKTSEPIFLKLNEWHTPYINEEEKSEWSDRKSCMVSAARCARVSYLTHDGVRDPEKDVEMFQNTLMVQKPPHWSPLEHVATPSPYYVSGEGSKHYVGNPGNFLGWLQLRHMFLPGD